MKRIAGDCLKHWCSDPHRKPLIIRGARQVGKTTQVRQLAVQFQNFVELNFESLSQLSPLFEGDLNPQRLITDLQLLTQQKIVPGKTLLFLDEVQICPRALISLRYFYEKLPALHVIAAGSLLDFAIEKVGVPVGRVSFLYMYPMSFIEFLWAMKQEFLAEAIQQAKPTQPFNEAIHEKALRLFGEYIAIGGMPEAVEAWSVHRDYQQCLKIHLPGLIATDFRFTQISTEVRKRELEPALQLLTKANIVTPIYATAAQGLPLGAGVDYQHYKLIMLDVALTQALLGQTAENWILDPVTQFANKGAIAEAFVGQELLAYSDSRMPAKLYYWQRQQRGSLSEVDFVMHKGQQIIPIEVKAGKGGTLKSMHCFLEEHPHSPLGIRFSTQNFSSFNQIDSYPLYAVASVMMADHSD